MDLQKMPNYHILPGLPGVGPWPLPFSATGQGMHREGLVVEFFPKSNESWIGNFQPGVTTLNTVVVAQDERTAFLIVGGQAYVVCIETRQLLAHHDNDIEFFHHCPDDGQVITGSNCDFTAYRSVDRLWRTRRISWDGFRNIEIESGCLRGEAWCFDDTWHVFSVALDSGKTSGGSYHELED